MPAVVIIALKVAGVIIAVIIIIDLGLAVYYWWKGTCRLETYFIFPNKCRGPCTIAGQVCTSIAPTTRYLIFLSQDTACACTAVVPTPGWFSTAWTWARKKLGIPSWDELTGKAKKVANEQDKRTDETNKAIDQASGKDNGG